MQAAQILSEKMPFIPALRNWMISVLLEFCLPAHESIHVEAIQEYATTLEFFLSIFFGFYYNGNSARCKKFET